MTRILEPLVLAQALVGARVLYRFLRPARKPPLTAVQSNQVEGERISVIVPVLNEATRLAPCLDGLLAQGPEVGEILIVDGGSLDGTQQLIGDYANRDARIRLLDASPVPAGWNGKSWGLQVGLDHANVDYEWMLTIDADVRPMPLLARSLVAQAHLESVPALSVATRQELGGAGEGFIHPTLLTTLVYRFGPPGYAATRIAQAQANGQCFLARLAVLRRSGGFVKTRASRCEDVTLARALVTLGYPVGFYEAGDLVSTRMYGNAAEVWRNWPRSLPLRDQYTRWSSFVGLVEVTLALALPLPMLALLYLLPDTSSLWWRAAVLLNVVLVALRLGTLFGVARAYSLKPWTYWLSPLCDLPAAFLLWRSVAQRRHIWRGRVLISGGAS